MLLNTKYAYALQHHAITVTGLCSNLFPSEVNLYLGIG